MSPLETTHRATSLAVASPRVRSFHVLALMLALLSSMIVLPSWSATAAVTASTAMATGPSLSMEDDFLSLLNGERTRRGLRALTRVDGVDNVAREWSDRMAREQKLYHRPGLANAFSGQWSRLGENVGVGYGPASLHRSFMDSPGHRANVLGDFDKVGVGVALSGSRAWVTFNFVKGDASTPSRYRDNPVTGYATGSGGNGPFYDLGSTVHDGDIKSLDALDLAVSCAGSRYCPDDPVRRGDMAAILTKALHLPAAAERFSDVSSSHRYAAEIGALAAAGITLGCNPPTNDRFCPETVVTRQQMASFFVRALELDTTRAQFRDVTSRNSHLYDIGGLADSRVTLGCNPPRNDRYCPGAPLTRGQIASFLTRGLGL